MDPPSTSPEAMDLFLLTSHQKQETLEKEGNQKGFLSVLTHKYQMQSFLQLPEWCPQITISYLFWADYSKATDIYQIFIPVLEVCSILTSSTTSFAFLLVRILQNLENIL